MAVWIKKYVMVKYWPKYLKGSSTGRPPIQVRSRKVATMIQKRIWVGGLNWYPCLSWMLMIGIKNSTRIAVNMATTPPSLLGIDRRMA